ncbi:17-beta-hydroxysteroid dehydrogenase type 1 isoform X1 [Rhea pennata]|uniref:17-beta-hydroxysteroid dehydrogenase type 1 isoform X1 n=1 Tax=Rhea pennata TaxID=8795 RepID=UPI002E265B19
MEKTTVLITGCSSGIGLALAARLASDAAQRFKVYATMRDPAKGERLRERLGGCRADALEVLQLDVTNPRSLADAAQRLQGQRLDVLVCNAGVGLMGPLETCSEQAMKSVFDVNLFGAVRTIQAFLPAMKRRRAGRIVVSSSIGGLQGGRVLPHGLPCRAGSRRGGARLSGRRSAPGVPFNSVYCASKFAVEGLCESLAVVLQPFNVHVTLVECGPVNTSFLDNLQRPDPEGAELQGLDAETRGLYRRYLRHCQSLFREAAQDVEEVVQVFLEALSSPRPPLRCLTTQRFAPLARLRLGSPDGSDFLRAMHAFVFGGEEA